MKKIRRVVIRTLDHLPEIFELMPDTDYRRLYSHSAVEVTKKAWAMTSQQLNKSFITFEEENPDVKRKLTKATA